MRHFKYKSQVLSINDMINHKDNKHKLDYNALYSRIVTNGLTVEQAFKKRIRGGIDVNKYEFKGLQMTLNEIAKTKYNVKKLKPAYISYRMKKYNLTAEKALKFDLPLKSKEIEQVQKKIEALCKKYKVEPVKILNKFDSNVRSNPMNTLPFVKRKILYSLVFELDVSVKMALRILKTNHKALNRAVKEHEQGVKLTRQAS